MLYQVLNSFSGKPGNIGVRTDFILKNLTDDSQATICFCRGFVNKYELVDYKTMSIFGHIPRIMNAASIYLIPGGYNHRLYDIAFFQWFVMTSFKKMAIENGGIAHLWEYCPKLIFYLKERGVRVVLDVPIAPLSYNRRLKNEEICDFLLVSDRLEEIEYTSFKMADYIVAPSIFVRDELILGGVEKDKINVIEFGAKVNSKELKENAKFLKKDLNFCFVGNVSKRKGVLELLSAWSHPVFKSDRLHLCGRVYPEVKSNIANTKSGEILMPGFIDPYEYLLQCDVFVLPSWLEGSAKAVYEAMTMGLPSIVTKSSGSIIRNGIDGFVVDAGDVNALQDRMVWMKNHPRDAMRMGESAKRRAKDFTWERYASRVTSLYRQIEDT